MAKIEIKDSKNDQFYFIIKAKNGAALATSEMYESKQGCKNGIASVVDAIKNNLKIIDLTKN